MTKPKIRRGKGTPNKTLFWGNGGEWSKTSKWSSATQPTGKTPDLWFGGAVVTFIKPKRKR